MNVMLPPNAIAMISVTPKKESRVTILDSGKSGVFVTVGYQKMVLQPTDQLLISQIPSSDIAHPRYTSRKSKADVAPMLQRQFMLNCRTFTLMNAWPYKKLEDRYKLAFRQRLTSELQPKMPETRNKFMPIDYTVTLKSKIVSQQDLPNSWMSTHAELRQDGHFYLNSGSILIHASTPMVVETPEGSVFMKKDVVALISAQKDMTRVFNLKDKHRGSLIVVQKNRSVKLDQGREAALMSMDSRNISRVVLGDEIGHKNLFAQRVDDKHGIVIGEFSMADMLAYQPLLRMLRSSTNATDKDLVEDLIKTAAAKATMDLGM